MLHMNTGMNIWTAYTKIRCFMVLLLRMERLKLIQSNSKEFGMEQMHNVLS